MRLAAATLVAALLGGLPAAAADVPLTGPEFDAHTLGRTLTFGVGGVPYGVEQYLPGRQVIWAFVDQPCRRGVWYEDAPGVICFAYEHDPTPQCWNFFADPTGLRARFLGGGMGPDLVQVDDSPDALSCPGPDVGA
jgi:hypothetical protein